jgi:hypothetical protein
VADAMTTMPRRPARPNGLINFRKKCSFSSENFVFYYFDAFKLENVEETKEVRFLGRRKNGWSNAGLPDVIFSNKKSQSKETGRNQLIGRVVI